MLPRCTESASRLNLSEEEVIAQFQSYSIVILLINLSVFQNQGTVILKFSIILSAGSIWK
jgi:hypothetical protein